MNEEPGYLAQRRRDASKDRKKVKASVDLLISAAHLGELRKVILAS
jgi:hypothetical protein